MATSKHEGFEADEWICFCAEWEDMRFRLTGGRYGRMIVSEEDKKSYIERELAKSMKSYEHACKRLDYRAARMLKRRIAILEEIAEDYAER